MRVAVAGAGIAGLAAALALARRGFPVELFERAALEETGSGIQLSPNAMAVLERLDLASGLRQHLVGPRAVEMRDACSGSLLASMPLGETARSRYGSPYAVIHRGDLQSSLLQAVRSEKLIALHLQAEVSEVRQAETGLAFNAGGRSVLADVLVGADGVRSRLRTGVFGHAGPQSLRRTAWRASLPAEAVPASIALDATILWLGRGVHVVHYPVSAGALLNIVVIGPEGAAAAAVPENAGWTATLAGLIAAVPAWSAWPLLAVDAKPTWVNGRAVLIGDAAHAMPPSAAQGGAQAIEDAWVLAACLAARPDADRAALAAYERLRRPRVERIVREAHRNLGLYGLRGVAGAARNLAIRALPGRLHLARLDWLYGWKPG